MQAGQSLVKMLRKNHFYPTERKTGDLEAPTDPGHTSLGFASLAWRQWDIHDPKNVEANVWEGVTNGDEGS